MQPSRAAPCRLQPLDINVPRLHRRPPSGAIRANHRRCTGRDRHHGARALLADRLRRRQGLVARKPDRPAAGWRGRGDLGLTDPSSSGRRGRVRDEHRRRRPAARRSRGRQRSSGTRRTRPARFHVAPVSICGTCMARSGLISSEIPATYPSSSELEREELGRMDSPHALGRRAWPGALLPRCSAVTASSASPHTKSIAQVPPMALHVSASTCP